MKESHPDIRNKLANRANTFETVMRIMSWRNFESEKSAGVWKPQWRFRTTVLSTLELAALTGG